MTAEPNYAKAEEVAKIVYDAMLYDRTHIRPDWVEGGNSLAQDEARRAARKIIELVAPAD